MLLIFFLQKTSSGNTSKYWAFEKFDNPGEIFFKKD